MKTILFDSYAILKFHQDEPGADNVEKLLTAAQQGSLKAFMSEINLGEVYYMNIRRLGIDVAQTRLEQFLDLAVQIVPPSSAIIRSAAEIKAEHAISYADCFAVAVAARFQATVITGDPEFKKVEHLVDIDWI